MKSVMIARCYAENYRCLSNFEVNFEPLSVLLGTNGSGKSSVIGLIAKLRDFILGRGTSLELFPPETLTRWDKRAEQTFELVIRHELGVFQYRLSLRHAPEQSLNKVLEEMLNLDGKPLFAASTEKLQIFNDRHEPKVELLPDWHVSGIFRVEERKENLKLTAFRRAMERVLVLAINPALVSAVSAEKRPVIIPEVDCSNFAGWLSHISRTEALALREAEQKLALGGLPGFLLFQPYPSGDASILQCVFKSASPSGKPYKFRLDELSSGQIALVILETAIAVVNEHRGVLLLDEPGNFLGLSEIQPLLTRLQDAALEERFQVILTAHHPIAVDFLAAAHGQWLEREPSGTTRVQRIEVADDVRQGKSSIRISDLVARGWLSGLGVHSHEVPAKGTDPLPNFDLFK